MLNPEVAVPGFPGYTANADGVVSSRGRPLRPYKVGRNMAYRKVALHRNGVRHERYVHHVILETFVGPRPEGMEACHENDIKTDNRLHNLRWGTRSSNAHDTTRNAKRPTSQQTYSREKVEEVRKLLGEGMQGTEISRRTGMGVCSVSAIKNGKTHRLTK